MRNRTFLLFLFLGFLSLHAQNIVIPDANFKNTLVNTLCVDTDGDFTSDADADTNNDGEISVAEALAVQNLYMDNRSINSLEGIYYFSNLVRLSLLHNNLVTLNVTVLHQLEELTCSYNLLTSIDISGLDSLAWIDCSRNDLAAINLSATPNLTHLFINFNHLSSLDVSALSALRMLAMDNNQIGTINLTMLHHLENLWAYENPMTSLDLRNGEPTAFTFIYPYPNPLLQTVCVDEGDTFMDYNGPVTSLCELAVAGYDKEEFVMFPNPVQGIVHFSQMANSVSVTDMTGKVVRQNFYDTNEIDFSELQSGIYLLRVVIGSCSEMQKIVKL